MNLLNLPNNELAKLILSLIDLTSLNEADSNENIIDLCKKAITPIGNVAAVCIYPRFVKLAKRELAKTNIKIATVCNFPSGDEDLDQVLQTTADALGDGADEIDLVVRFKDYLEGDRISSKELIWECKNLCGPSITLKTILETGALRNPELITMASHDAIDNGADFLKTSTGKIPIGATTEAARAMLAVIKETKQYSNRDIGFKASGGIKTIDQALDYLKIASSIMGETWINPSHFRFGASSLLKDILNL